MKIYSWSQLVLMFIPSEHTWVRSSQVPPLSTTAFTTYHLYTAINTPHDLTCLKNNRAPQKWQSAEEVS